MGEWTGSDSAVGPPPYAENYSWVVEGAASLPSVNETAFWDWLFKSMADVGLGVYKLDHTQQQMPNMNYTTRSLGVTAAWLHSMAAAAARHGVDKQYPAGVRISPS